MWLHLYLEKESSSLFSEITVKFYNQHYTRIRLIEACSMAYMTLNILETHKIKPNNTQWDYTIDRLMKSCIIIKILLKYYKTMKVLNSIPKTLKIYTRLEQQN